MSDLVSLSALESLCAFKLNLMEEMKQNNIKKVVLSGTCRNLFFCSEILMIVAVTEIVIIVDCHSFTLQRL